MLIQGILCLTLMIGCGCVYNIDKLSLLLLGNIRSLPHVIMVHLRFLSVLVMWLIAWNCHQVSGVMMFFFILGYSEVSWRSSNDIASAASDYAWAGCSNAGEDSTNSPPPGYMVLA